MMDLISFEGCFLSLGGYVNANIRLRVVLPMLITGRATFSSMEEVVGTTVRSIRWLLAQINLLAIYLEGYNRGARHPSFTV